MLLPLLVCISPHHALVSAAPKIFFPEALQRTPSSACTVCGDIVPTVIGTCRVIGAPVAVQSRSAWYRALCGAFPSSPQAIPFPW
ncbi:unnamed protein product [Urochloa humidicola]